MKKIIFWTNALMLIGQMPSMLIGFYDVQWEAINFYQINKNSAFLIDVDHRSISSMTRNVYSNMWSGGKQFVTEYECNAVFFMAILPFHILCKYIENCKIKQNAFFNWLINDFKFISIALEFKLNSIYIIYISVWPVESL